MPKLKIQLLLGLIMLLIFSDQAFGQASYSNSNWYFGSSNYGIRFNRPLGDVSLDSTNMAPTFGRFGNATANEPETGNLLFYTDGSLIFDAGYQLMDGLINPGSLLDADINKNQNTAIVSEPTGTDRYLIFTNTPGGAIHYSIVDMSSTGNAVFPQPALGSVILLNQPIANSTANASDALLAIAKSDLSGYWLVTVDQGSNTYKVLDINGADPSAWMEQSFPLASTPLLNAANLSYSPVVRKIAVAPSSPNTNIQILDFDPDLGIGTITFDREILNSGNSDQATEAIYDTEWSPDGAKLYISRYGGIAGVGDLLQWDSTLPSTSSLVSILPVQVFGSYGLQIGPDLNIYHLYQEFGGAPYTLGAISDVDSVAALVQYSPQVFNDQDFDGLQFPALLPPRQTPLALDFTFAGTCSNTPTTFYPIITPAPDLVLWDFGDGTGSSPQLAPVYTYTAGGSFNVTLSALLNGQVQTIQKPITITQFDLQITVPSDTVACQCELPKYNDPTCTPFSVTATASGGSGGETYIWSNGDSGPTLTPDSAGYYYVIVTDPAVPGCSAYAGVNVQEYGAVDQRANVWYFGQNAGIDFNPPGANAIDDGIMDAPEGCTAISDRNGAIVFYTDGNDVFIKDKVTGVHSQVDTGLGGNPGSAQSVVAVPFPNDETLYYIFTTEEIGNGTGNFEFKYSVFDIKLNGGIGGVTEKNIPLFTKSTERITANNNWVIIHEYGNNNFRAYPLTATGLGNAIVSSMGSDHSTSAPEFGQGYMKFSQDGTKIAVALADGAGQNYVDVFEWTDSLGQVTDYKRLDLTADGAVGKVYGVEFFSTKLFATVQGAGSSMIMEYRADTLSLMHSINPIMSSPNILGAIQVAPNNQVMVASEGSGSLGVINVQPDTAQASTYNANGFALAGGTTSHLGLPNYASQFGNSLMTPSIFVSSPVCLGQPITMSAVTTSIIDTAFWQIADNLGNIVFTSQNLVDSTTLNTTGDFLVSLLIGNRCGFSTAFSQTITVNAPPDNSTLPAGMPLCGTSSVLDVYNVPPTNITDLAFAWSTGETTPAITVTAQGTYSVIMTDVTSGCTNTASVFVGPPFLVDLGPDQNNCETDPLILDSQANASIYAWFINNVPVVPANNQRTFDFGAQALLEGVYTVRVEVEDPVDPNCVVVDETIITVNALPAFTAIESAPVSTCGGSDGVMSINITTAGNFTYTVTGPVNITSQPLVGPDNNFLISNLSVGVYAVAITNNVSACTQQLGNIIITEPVPFTIQNVVPVNDDCIGGNGQITFNLDMDAGAVDYIVRDQINPTNPAITGTSATSGPLPADVITIANLPAGTYSLEVTDVGGGCTDSNSPIVVNPTPATDLQVVPTIAECGTTLSFSTYASSATGGASLFWDLSSTGAFANDVTLVDYTDLGNQTVFIKASSGTTCDSIMSVDVTLVPTPTVTITVDDTDICNGNVTLTAVAAGGFAAAQLGYRWSTGETTESIVVSQTSTPTINISNLQNLNCFTSANEAVTIPTAFTVSLSSTLACDDGSPFILSATATNVNVDYSWKLDGIELPDITSQIQSITAGTFEVTATDRGAGNCSNLATLEIIKAPVTPTDLSSTQVFCPDEGAITLDAGADFISYLWSTGESTQTIDVGQGGVYTIDAVNNFRCVTTDQTELIEDCIPKVYGPTAFRPGGLNNEYYLFTEYVDTFEIFIFNRWGEMVYQSDDINFRWDGMLNGELLPADQYSWVVRYTSSFRDRGTLEQYGGVVLLR